MLAFPVSSAESSLEKSLLLLIYAILSFLIVSMSQKYDPGMLFYNLI